MNAFITRRESTGTEYLSYFSSIINRTAVSIDDYAITEIRVPLFANFNNLKYLALNNCSIIKIGSMRYDNPFDNVGISCFITNCNQLKSIILPNLASCIWALNAPNFNGFLTPFGSSPALETLYFSGKTMSPIPFYVRYNLHRGLFYNLSKLSSVYMMFSQVQSFWTYSDYLESYGVFYSTPMDTTVGGAYGSIYVPASLVSEYQSAEYWSVYSERFVGV